VGGSSEFGRSGKLRLLGGLEGTKNSVNKMINSGVKKPRTQGGKWGWKSGMKSGNPRFWFYTAQSRGAEIQELHDFWGALSQKTKGKEEVETGLRAWKASE